MPSLRRLTGHLLSLRPGPEWYDRTTPALCADRPDGVPRRLKLLPAAPTSPRHRQQAERPCILHRLPRRPGHRRDIDGLRAVAVLPVILFHAGLPAFAGGYLGVDVFFVISGFLITGILAARPARRAASRSRASTSAAPAASCRRWPSCSLACIPFGLAWMSPLQLADLGRGIVATALSVSNVLFWQQLDYFGPAAEHLPLLHTWSLGIEEQFYLLFPLALAALWRWRPAGIGAASCWLAAPSASRSLPGPPAATRGRLLPAAVPRLGAAGRRRAGHGAGDPAAPVRGAARRPRPRRRSSRRWPPCRSASCPASCRWCSPAPAPPSSCAAPAPARPPTACSPTRSRSASA